MEKPAISLTTWFDIPMSDKRLIEDWLPIEELGIESLRERTPMTPYPAPNRLHVWWARRPLVASRAAILASLLPADANHEKFLHVLGIHGNPVAARTAIDEARRSGRRVTNPYNYDRAFKYLPTQNIQNEEGEEDSDLNWLEKNINSSLNTIRVCDPTAGGGSIPFEAARFGLGTIGNDLNPVAALILKATVAWPTEFYDEILDQFTSLASEWRAHLENRLGTFFPQKADNDQRDHTYLWARTITCPYCNGLVPLSPNWKLAPDGTGVRLKPNISGGPGTEGRACSFEIVENSRDQSQGTVTRGDAICPFLDCGRVIDSDEIKRQAQSGHVGEQLFAIVYKRQISGKNLKSGKEGRKKWVRGYRTPDQWDDNSAEAREYLEQKLPEWEALDIVPRERMPDGYSTSHPKQYGVSLWNDLFSPRQLLCHGISVEVFRDMLEADRKRERLNDPRKAAYGYLAIVIDTMLNYNSRCGRWDSTTCRVRSIFDRHDFAFVWSYGEMAPLVKGVGFDWAIQKTVKCINELLSLIDPKKECSEMEDMFADEYKPPPISISCKSGDSLDHIEDGSIDAVVMDPPYYDNVMYAELSDFFYVWLKRTAGYIYPELFRRNLTDKENEAVANPGRFHGMKGAKALARREYQERMSSIFAECRRVLKPDGIMTLMFTHKATGAWDALTKGLMESGFMIKASWPIKTEAEGSLHIRNKAAANSTIFLVCRPRPKVESDQVVYWEEVESEVAEKVHGRIRGFEKAGIKGVDLYLASFGPALEVFSSHWPLKRGTPRERSLQRKMQSKSMIEEENDPYMVTPEDALDAARREVKKWRLEQITNLKTEVDLDTTTAFFVLAWDAFQAPKFSYDEALRLARAVGVNLDRDVVGRLAKKEGSNIVLWDSSVRAAKGTLGPADASRGMIDAIHHAANQARTRSLKAAQQLLADTRVDQNPSFKIALKAVIEVLPQSKSFTEFNLEGDLAASGDDYEALYNLNRLFYSDRVKLPEQEKIGFENKN